MSHFPPKDYFTRTVMHSIYLFTSIKRVTECDFQLLFSKITVSLLDDFDALRVKNLPQNEGSLFVDSCHVTRQN